MKLCSAESAKWSWPRNNYSYSDTSYFAPSALSINNNFTWGVAPGCYISRPWRCELYVHPVATAPGSAKASRNSRGGSGV